MPEMPKEKEKIKGKCELLYSYEYLAYIENSRLSRLLYAPDIKHLSSISLPAL